MARERSVTWFRRFFSVRTSRRTLHFPHLVDFRERIRINGQCISEDAVVDFVDRWQTDSADWGTPSFFELTFAMAMDEFERQGCDIVVLETGMGGRLDSTNVIPSPEVAVVTNIGLDHQAFLGTDIRSIAREKGGIFKSGCLWCWGRCARMPNLNCWQRL